jgi:hypothetical protein
LSVVASAALRIESGRARKPGCCFVKYRAIGFKFECELGVLLVLVLTLTVALLCCSALVVQ